MKLELFSHPARNFSLILLLLATFLIFIHPFITKDVEGLLCGIVTGMLFGLGAILFWPD